MSVLELGGGWRRLLIAATAASIAACSGSSSASAGAGTPGDPPGRSGGPYAFFGGRGVSAVDLAAPSAPPAAVHVGENAGLSLVLRGRYDPATASVTDLAPHAALWISGGRIYRESADAGPLRTPAQVSSVSTIGDSSPSRVTATHLCRAYAVTDWARPDASQYLFALAGSDRDCDTDDDALYMVRLDTPATAAPIRVDVRPVKELLDPATGAITGWLAIDGGYRLVRTDPAFGTRVVVSTGPAWARPVGASATHQYLAVPAAGGTYAVHRFDLAAGTFDPTAVLTAAGPVESGISDGTDLFLSVRRLNGPDSVWRLPLAATTAGSAVQMSSEAPGASIWSVLHLTSSHVVLVVRDAAGVHHLAALDKTAAGTSPGTNLAEAPAGTSLELLATAADTVYYETEAASGARSAFAVTGTGSPVISQPAATWVGFAYQTAWRGGARGEPVVGLLATGLAETGSAGGARVRAVTLATGAIGADLGTLPADLATFDKARLVGTKGLLCGHLPDLYGEVLYVDVSTPGSLIRATSTPRVSESLPSW